MRRMGGLMFRYSKNRRSTIDGSPIIWTAPVIDGGNAGDGPQTRPKKYGTAHVKGKNGTMYAVPVDKKGKVPTSAVFARLLDVDTGTRDGHRRSVEIDLSREAQKIHEMPSGGFTPEQIIGCGWWMYPAESDIKGIDDPSTIAFGEEDAMATASKIAIIGPKEDRDRIQKVLKDNFTRKELKTAVADQGIVITVAPAGRGSSGWYMGKQHGVTIPQIVVEPGASEDTITHEFIHHLRRVDESREGVSRCPFPLTDEKALGAGYISLPEKRKAALNNWEEAATVAESTVRTRQPEAKPTGYYVHIPDGRENYPTWYNEDRSTMTRGISKNSPQRGRRAVSRVNSRFGNTHISGLRFKQGKSAREAVAEAASNGTLPKASSPGFRGGSRLS